MAIIVSIWIKKYFMEERMYQLKLQDLLNASHLWSFSHAPYFSLWYATGNFVTERKVFRDKLDWFLTTGPSKMLLLRFRYVCDVTLHNIEWLKSKEPNFHVIVFFTISCEQPYSKLLQLFSTTTKSCNIFFILHSF